MSLLNFIESIGEFFVGLFNKVEKAWVKLAPEVQQATLQASGIIAILNANVSAVPSEIWSLIQSKYPGVTQASVTAALVKANNTVNGVNAIASESTFDEAVIALQGYLSNLKGNEFIIIVKAVVTIVADIFAPGSVIQKIELVLEFVYQSFIKGQTPVITIATPPSAAAA